ncbi:heavy-metal-associated domain-containing protein [uncultured Roseivirga sp.]|jgi:copper chaperone CopZ|uniref:heavy-metal-associated domain-containing protein n=1 Tax=uncultured Roseivirga sp. TaxID=543088 RepID=UPI0030D9113A|tara:strand:- start:28041 stop:28274 length:234 start_codon:yes stop_codon:yes gene_type:complete
MKKAVYKTNINCGNCLSTVTPFLNDLKEVSEWSVDLASKDRLLTVKAENINSDLIIKAVEQAGFKAEKKKSVLGKLF